MEYGFACLAPDANLIYALTATDGGVQTTVEMVGATAICTVSTLNPGPYRGPIQRIHFSDTARGTAAEKAITFAHDCIAD